MTSLQFCQISVSNEQNHTQVAEIGFCASILAASGTTDVSGTRDSEADR